MQYEIMKCPKKRPYIMTFHDLVEFNWNFDTTYKVLYYICSLKGGGPP